MISWAARFYQTHPPDPASLPTNSVRHPARPASTRSPDEAASASKSPMECQKHQLLPCTKLDILGKNCVPDHTIQHQPDALLLVPFYRQPQPCECALRPQRAHSNLPNSADIQLFRSEKVILLQEFPADIQIPVSPTTPHRRDLRLTNQATEFDQAQIKICHSWTPKPCARSCSASSDLRALAYLQTPLAKANQAS